MARIRLILRYKSRVFTSLARCTHRSAEQGPLLGCERVGVPKPAFFPVRRHPAAGSHPRARGALYGGGGAPRAVGIRPEKCAQVRLHCSALTFGYAVRLRPVSRRLACGSRRNAPRFMTIDRSLVRPFPHRRYAYRVRGASARARRTARRKRGLMYGDLTRQVRLDSTS